MLWPITIIVLTALFSLLYRLINTNPWMLFLWIPLAIITTLILTVILIYFVTIPLIFKLKESNKFRAFLTYQTTSFILPIAKIKIKVTGRENLVKETNVMYVSNHKSLIDPVFVFHATRRPCSTAGKVEIWKDLKFLSFLFKKIDVLTIDRDDDRKAVKEILRGVEKLKNNKSVLIFTEGGIKTREVEQMVDIKAGAYKLATKSDAIIQPLAIHGNSKVETTKGKKKILVEILKPIYPEEYQNLNTHEIGEMVLNIVNEHFQDEPKYELKEEN